MFIRSVLLVGSAVVGMLPRQAQAQSGSATTSPAAVPNPFAVTNVKRYPVSKSVFGDAGIIVNARDDGFIEVAAAGPTKTVLVQLRTMAARGWLDSTTRMMRARPKRSADAISYRSDVSDAAGKAKMALTRAVTAGKSEYSLAFADDPASAFTVPIEESEADVFVAVVRKAVAQATKLLDKPDTAATVDSAPPPKKKPAVKRKATPPATTPATPTPKPTTKPATPKPATSSTAAPAKPA
ncbi:MAG TPA: hypothetical protein VM076_00765 [Gemmatimonadaceae bacterium]|nr:hypothetical protein [Gemmatimonadaceae bacterium]